MRHVLLVVTACAALVVAYFVSSVVFRPSGAAAEAQTNAKAATQPEAKPAAKPAAEPPKLTALLPDSPGFYNLQLAAKVAGKPVALPCRVFIPREYDKNKDPRPLLVFLHGEDERGTDLSALAKVGPEKKLREDQG